MMKSYSKIFKSPVEPDGPYTFWQFNTLMAKGCSAGKTHEVIALILINKRNLKYFGAYREVSVLLEKMNLELDKIRDGFKNHTYGPLFRYNDIRDAMNDCSKKYNDVTVDYNAGDNPQNYKANLVALKKKVASLNKIIEGSIEWTTEMLEKLDGFTVLTKILACTIPELEGVPAYWVNNYDEIIKKKDVIRNTIKVMISEGIAWEEEGRVRTGFFSAFRSESPASTLGELIDVISHTPDDSNEYLVKYADLLKKEINWFNTVESHDSEMHLLFLLMIESKGIARYCNIINELISKCYMEIMSIAGDCTLLSKRIERFPDSLNTESDSIDEFYLDMIGSDWTDAISKWDSVRPK